MKKYRALEVVRWDNLLGEKVGYRVRHETYGYPDAIGPTYKTRREAEEAMRILKEAEE